MPAIIWAGVGLAALALIGLVASKHRAQPIGPLTADMVASALRWGAAYGVPPSWITATMIVESNGNPRIVGDQGRSIGLMQINYGANTALLAKLGVQPGQLYDPDTNIHVGTAIMRQALDAVLAALGGRSPPAPLDVLVRLYYRGPALVLNALKAGRNPVDSFSDAAVSVANWRAALNRTSAVV